MPFNFPDSPTEGQVFTPPGGPVYKYEAPVWKASFPDADALAYVPEAPMDAQVYGRVNATWVAMAGGTGDNTPVGTVIWSACTTPPTGYLKADGASLLRSSYANLFAAIGTTYGAVDGTHFTLPDLRGEFVRGFDDGRGVDSGRVQGVAQGEAIKAHTHPFTGTPMPTHNHTASSGTESADHRHYVSGYTGTDGAHTHATVGANTGVTRTPYNNASGSALASGSDLVSSSGSAHYHSINFYSGYRDTAHTHAITVVAISAGTPAGTIGDNAGSPAETRPRNVALLACIKF